MATFDQKHEERVYFATLPALLLEHTFSPHNNDEFLCTRFRFNACVCALIVYLHGLAFYQCS
jgi:hypothetical protein